MNKLNLLFGFTNIFCGITFIAISIPLLKRKIKMNYYYGFRVKKAFVSKENWYKINEYGAKHLIIWSSLTILTGIVCFFIPVTIGIHGIIPMSVFTLIPMIKTLIFSRKL